MSLIRLPIESIAMPAEIDQLQRISDDYIEDLRHIIESIGLCVNVEKSKEFIQSMKDNISSVAADLEEAKTKLKNLDAQVQQRNNPKIHGFLNHPCRDTVISNKQHSVRNYSKKYWRTVLYGQFIPLGTTTYTLQIDVGYCVGIAFVPLNYNKLNCSRADKDQNSMVNYYDKDLYVCGRRYENQGLKIGRDDTIKITVEMSLNGGNVAIFNQTACRIIRLPISYPKRLAFELGSKDTQITVS